jgi:hypothetical protein
MFMLVLDPAIQTQKPQKHAEAAEEHPFGSNPSAVSAQLLRLLRSSFR